MKMKLKEKTKQYLISIRNLNYTPKNQFDEYYFKGMMLCSDMLMNKDKLKPAQTLIENVMTMNNSSLLGYEYLFLITEKNKGDLLPLYDKAN